ncbi:hypothetical protein BGW39_009094 [Mortierella sp. 14UC]|nr:hypothetical protein BGW39_009094 [Mortierella sp. 14UC]
MSVEPESVRSQVERYLLMIVRLEVEESRYISLLQVQSPAEEDNLEASHIFNADTDFQDERFRLLDIRRQMIVSNSDFKSLLNDLEENGDEDDFFRAGELRFMMHHTMMWRRDRLLFERQFYIVHGNGQGQGINAIHARQNLLVATIIDDAFRLSVD